MGFEWEINELEFQIDELKSEKALRVQSSVREEKWESEIETKENLDHERSSSRNQIKQEKQRCKGHELIQDIELLRKDLDFLQEYIDSEQESYQRYLASKLDLNDHTWEDFTSKYLSPSRS